MRLWSVLIAIFVFAVVAFILAVSIYQYRRGVFNSKTPQWMRVTGWILLGLLLIIDGIFILSHFLVRVGTI